MSSRVPAETVVTAWVYPDSFGEFRKLKTALYREGFLAAARPLPPEILIDHARFAAGEKASY